MTLLIFTFLTVAFNFEAPQGGIVLLPFLADKRELSILHM